EASGIAEPSEVKRMLLMSKNKNVTYGGLVYVIDAAHFNETKATHSDVEKHVALADCVVLNKIDLINSQSEEEIIALCRAINKQAPILKTIYGEVDPKFLFDIEVEETQQLTLAHQHDDHALHMHSQYTSLEFITSEPLSPKHFLEYIKKPLTGI